MASGGGDSKAKGAFCLPSIQHAVFQGGTLRGLEWTGGGETPQDKVAIGIPSNLVLRAPYKSDSGAGGERVWDRDLALGLLRECQRGPESSMYGYCQLLTLGTALGRTQKDAATTTPPPPSTAPDALRRWTSEEKAYLAQSCALGKRLVEVEEAQAQRWQAKYQSLAPSDQHDFSLPDFIWAMEAVHSRAFKGNFAVGPSRQAAAIALPLLSAAALAAQFQGGQGDVHPAVLLALAAVAISPGVITALEEARGALAEAVLLPLIDSANHLQSAQSKIEYDPLQDLFTLSLGDGCLVPDAGETTQVYISYGAQTDAELILNYGFLPGVPTTNNADRTSVRRALADAFAQRNK